jgi:deazaflavin-dependent oxidoreductase (nitroreductase family)
MTETATTEIRLPDDRPPAWANSLMTWALTTPVVQSMVGSAVALLTFTGRRSGKVYTIPVSYLREGDVVTIITKRLRKWWHNFEQPAEVELRLGGHTHRGKAEIRGSDNDVLEFMMDYLNKRPVDTKAYGLGKEITREKVAAIVPHFVLISIEVSP